MTEQKRVPDGRNRIKVKICGIRRREDVEIINRYLPDYAGFVFAPGKRRIDMEKAMELRRGMDGRIRTVGVFVNEEQEKIRAVADAGIIEMIQLHGDEDGEYMKRIKEMTGLPVIKAVRVRERADILRAAELPADFILFDTYTEKEYGGSGKSFNWELLAECGRTVRRPYFLAGGLHAGNVGNALRAAAGTESGMFAVDVSSGVETDGGKEDEKIKEFIRIVRSGRVGQLKYDPDTKN